MCIRDSLYTPCAAAVAVMHRELGIRGGFFLIVAFQTVLAWSISFIVYQLALLFGQSVPLFLVALIGLVALIAISLKLINFGIRRRNAL